MARKTKRQTNADMKKLFAEIKEKGPKAISIMREAFGPSIDIMTPDEFYKTLNKPVESRAAKFFKDVKEGKAKIHPSSRLIEVDPKSGKWRWRAVKDNAEFLKLMEESETKAPRMLQEIREQRIKTFLNKQSKVKEDGFDGGGFDGTNTSAPGTGYEVKSEYTPLLGTPFFKQMYLYDYLLMHSKVFWYKNYSGPAKLIVNIIRNFVVGEGFSVSCKDDKAMKAWEKYEERNLVHEKLPIWCDELTFAGELMLEKKMTPQGVVHSSIDPSTIWEIVTDPENIEDIKYYHQQYPTQYQIFTDGKTPMSEYILRQIPPQLVHHVKVNVTSWEKRGRSDLLAALLYLKYFDDYIGFKLQRTKGEAAYFWDVAIDGDSGDVANYISTTQSTVDVPPGSENVHNKAVTRTALAPSMSHSGSDDVAKWILSYIFMSVNIPSSYAGTLESTSASRASALVSSEPVTKMMEERRYKLEWLLHRIWEDVMIDAGMDPQTEVEFNFPEIIVEDRSKKMEDLVLAKNEQAISHQRMSEIMAKELNVTTYDYDEEQKKISDEKIANATLLDPAASQYGGGQPPAGEGEQDLTKSKDSQNTKGNHALDRDAVRKQDSQQPL